MTASCLTTSTTTRTPCTSENDCAGSQQCCAGVSIGYNSASPAVTTRFCDNTHLVFQKITHQIAINGLTSNASAVTDLISAVDCSADLNPTFWQTAYGAASVLAYSVAAVASALALSTL